MYASLMTPGFRGIKFLAHVYIVLPKVSTVQVYFTSAVTKVAKM